MKNDPRLSPGDNRIKGIAVWLTGLSGSGKTTISIPLQKRLEEMGYRVQTLDGDVVRQKLTPDLSFSKEDRDKNIKRVTFVAELLVRHGIIVLCAFISPYREERRYARRETVRFVEVYVKCPLEICEERDVKGLYLKARRGEIKHFTGIDDPYEEPEHPEITVETDNLSVEEEVEVIINHLQENNFIE